MSKKQGKHLEMQFDIFTLIWAHFWKKLFTNSNNP